MGVHDGHRERLKQRFRETGLENFQEHEVLELLLFFAIPYRDTNGLAHRLLEEFGSLAAVCDASPARLKRVPGVGENAATLLNLISPLTRRYLISVEGEIGALDSVEKLGRYLLPRFRGLRQETVYLLCLDAKYRLLRSIRMGDGDMNFVHINLRRAIQLALDAGAVYTVLSHNHTSGVALPSENDLQTTRELSRLMKEMGITLLDHIIIAEDDFVSMRQSNQI